MTTTTEYDWMSPTISVGHTFDNGETVIAYRQISEFRLLDDGDHNNAAFHCVLVRGGTNFHDYVVRTYSALRHGWQGWGGDYFHTLDEALRFMNKGA